MDYVSHHTAEALFAVDGAGVIAVCQCACAKLSCHTAGIVAGTVDRAGVIAVCQCVIDHVSHHTANITAIAADGAGVTEDEVSIFRAEMLAFLGEEYKKRGWVMQVHYGAFRNANEPMFNKLGPDTGWDMMGDKISITDLAKLFNFMEKKDALPRTVVYSLNPTDNASIGTLLGSFQTSGDGMPKLMQGSAWWFNDTLHGMREQMTSLASLSVFGAFLGMLTDSRSLTSYPRHEYFRRILCDLIGRMVEEGLYPLDIDALSEIVMDICYNNTKRYFGF